MKQWTLRIARMRSQHTHFTLIEWCRWESVLVGLRSARKLGRPTWWKSGTVPPLQTRCKCSSDSQSAGERLQWWNVTAPGPVWPQTGLCPVLKVEQLSEGLSLRIDPNFHWGVHRDSGAACWEFPVACFCRQGHYAEVVPAAFWWEAFLYKLQHMTG